MSGSRTALSIALALLPLACGDSAAAGRPRVAFVTNSVSDYWALAGRGAERAGRDHDVEVLVRMPPGGTGDEQKRILEDLLALGVAGIAVSPKDPEHMTALLDGIAARAALVTHDSDAPRSRRLCYVGMDNYTAGRLCGELIAEAVPAGGPIVLVVGNLDQDNARRRRQGIVDHLLGRPRDPQRIDPPDAVLRGDRYEIRATFTDQFDRQKTKAIAEDVLARWRDLACLVGLFEYEPPVLVDAVVAAGRLGQVAVVAFDENEATLQAVADGRAHGTVVQDPYEYGRRSIELLAALVREPDPHRRAALLPPDGFIDIPPRQLRRGDIASFRGECEQRRR